MRLPTTHIDEVAAHFDTTCHWVKKRYNDLTGRLKRKGECLVYTGHTNKHGYAPTSISNKRTYVHRFFLMLAKGLATVDKPFAVRTCKEPACCNPQHLYWTDQEGRLAHRDHSHETGRRALSDDQVRRVRALAADGVVQGDIATLFDISRQTVSAIVCRRTYKDIE